MSIGTSSRFLRFSRLFILFASVRLSFSRPVLKIGAFPFFAPRCVLESRLSWLARANESIDQSQEGLKGDRCLTATHVGKNIMFGLDRHDLLFLYFPKQEPFGVLSSERKSVTRLAKWVSRASGLWSPIMNTIGAIGAGWVSRARACSLPWSPIMSAIGANWGWVSDHEHNWGHWGRVGVTRFGPVVSHGLRS